MGYTCPLFKSGVGELPPGLDLLESLSGSVLAKLTGDADQPAPVRGEAEHST